MTAATFELLKLEQSETERVATAYLHPFSPDRIAEINQIFAQSEREVGTVRSKPGIIATASFDEGRFKIDWDSKVGDLEVLSGVYALVQASVKKSDEEYSNTILPEIKQFVSQSELFQQLTVQRSQNQQASPFDHTFEVAALTVTSGLDAHAIIQARFTAICHDLGKAFISINDKTQAHALISAGIFGEFAQHNGFSKEDQKEYFDVIRLHHLLEIVDKGIISIDEAIKIFPGGAARLLFGLLCLSDVSSSNVNFLAKNMDVYLEIIQKMIDKNLIQDNEVPGPFWLALIQILSSQHILQRAQQRGISFGTLLERGQAAVSATAKSGILFQNTSSHIQTPILVN